MKPSNMNRISLLLPILLMCFSSTQLVYAQTTHYVDASASGTNTGTSWANAFIDFQSALDAAAANDIINVAVGIYYPSKDKTGNTSPADPRDKTFYFDINLVVNGGFVGGVQQCDTANATIFSGDIGIANDQTDNTYNVCTSDFLSSATSINCIRIERGASEQTSLSGSAWFNNGSGTGNSSNPNFVDCYFVHNASGLGGAFINVGTNGGNASPTFTRCIFRENLGEAGGAMYNNAENNGNASPIVSHCQFIGNLSGEGGAMYNYVDQNGTSTPSISNSSFSFNKSSVNGGAVTLQGAFGNGQAIFTNCTFTGNEAVGNGGAAAVGTFGSNFDTPRFINCTFTGNLAAFNGGAIWCNVSSPLIDGCTFLQNQCTYNGGAIMCNGSQGEVSSPDILRCTFKLNFSGDRGGAVYLDGVAGTSSPRFHYCKFIQNESYDGGAVFGDGTIGICEPEFKNSIFSRNIASHEGGGLYLTSNAGSVNVTFEHCSFSRNNAFNFGTLIAQWVLGGGVCNIELYNCVSHGHGGIVLYDGSGTTSSGQNVTHENGWSNLWGFVNNGNCVIGSPLFVDPLNDDLNLQATSPAINSGSAAFTTQPFDLAGYARIIGIAPDRGAYEYDPCPKKLYVDIDATGLNNGLSWTNAFNRLQDAIDLARTCGVDTIWVAEGTYRPTKTRTGNGTNAANRANTFFINFDVVIQGGFQGFETNVNQRDWIQYETILSGNIGALGTSGDNCYNVVEYATCTNVSHLDGFTISGGNANDPGGGFGLGGGILINASPVIRHCKITSNYAVNGGGIGVRTLSGLQKCAILECNFIGNSGQVAGALMVTVSGGGTNSSYIANCAFRGNNAWNGGALAFFATTATSTCNPTVYNCEVWNNNASIGAAVLVRDASARLTNCSFSNNVGWGGKFYNGYAGTRSVIVENSITWNDGIEFANPAGQPFTVNRCIVLGGYGLGTNILTSNPLFVNQATGDLRLNAASPAYNAGLNSLMGVDTYDLDHDGNFTEQIDVDLSADQRIQIATIDLGAYEFGSVVSTEEIEPTLSSTVYPNPFGAGTQLTLERPTNDEVDMVIYNSMGQTIYRETVQESTYTIDTTDWYAGLYIIRLGNETLKVMKTN